MPLSIPSPFNLAAHFLDRPAAEHPERVAILGEPARITYGELAALTNRAGNAFLAGGVQRGQRVLIALPDSAEFMAAFFGAAKIGAIAVPVNPLSRGADFAYYAADCGASENARGGDCDSSFEETAVRLRLAFASWGLALLGFACGRDETKEPPAAVSARPPVVEPRELPRSAIGAGAPRGSAFEIRTIAEGAGPPPAAKDVVTVHYEGRLPDGRIFESSWARHEPATFSLNDVIPCWRKGLLRMKPGGTATLVCPPELAYGEQGVPGKIPPRATLTFEVALVSVRPATAANAAQPLRAARRSTWTQ